MICYLGIDVGTFESKGVLVDAGGGVIATAARPHQMIVPEPGWAEHRPREDWWGDFTWISKKLLADAQIKPTAIAAIGCSGIGPCMLPVDAGGEPLGNAILYGVDGRAAQEIAELTNQIGSDVLLERCGNTLTSQSVGPKVLWLKRHRPEVFAKTRKILNSTTYLVYKLTGAYVLDHYSAGSFGPFYSVDKRAWDPELAAGIADLELLPNLLWTTDIAGEVTSLAADETGLAAGTPVIAGTIDAAAEAISVGVLEAGDVMIMYGSTIFMIMLTNQRVRDPRLWYAPWLFPGRHACMAGLATSGTLTRWFSAQFARELDPSHAAMLLAKEAQTSPAGAKGLIFLPFFSGERTPIHDPQAKGCWFGFNLTHTRADAFRALLEGIANATNRIIETYVEAGQRARMVSAVGGGTRNQVWTQATSDISGWSQVLRAHTSGASYGNAFLAAMAIGDVVPSTILEWNPVVGEIVPQAANSERYRRQYEIYKDLYERTKDLMARLSAQPSLP
jgi:xylulokinase